MPWCYYTVILAPGSRGPTVGPVLVLALRLHWICTGGALEPPGFPGGIRENGKEGCPPSSPEGVMPHDEQPQ